MGPSRKDSLKSSKIERPSTTYYWKVLLIGRLRIGECVCELIAGELIARELMIVQRIVEADARVRHVIVQPGQLHRRLEAGVAVVDVGDVQILVVDRLTE